MAASAPRSSGSASRCTSTWWSIRRRKGVEKPDPRIFQRALERAGARPETTLHVGDLFHTDVVGARGAGLRAVLLDLGGLYHDHDCERVASLAELADVIESDGAEAFAAQRSNSFATATRNRGSTRDRSKPAITVRPASYPFGPSEKSVTAR